MKSLWKPTWPCGRAGVARELPLADEFLDTFESRVFLPAEDGTELPLADESREILRSSPDDARICEVWLCRELSDCSSEYPEQPSTKSWQSKKLSRVWRSSPSQPLPVPDAVVGISGSCVNSTS